MGAVKRPLGHPQSTLLRKLFTGGGTNAEGLDAFLPSLETDSEWHTRTGVPASALLPSSV